MYIECVAAVLLGTIKTSSKIPNLRITGNPKIYPNQIVLIDPETLNRKHARQKSIQERIKIH